MTMPGDWNGLELARRVREASPTTPVLLVTGFEPSGPVDACSGLLPKPFTADLLRSAVRRMIEPTVGCN
jgi:CheY-like chemotaxis protein